MTVTDRLGVIGFEGQNYYTASDDQDEPFYALYFLEGMPIAYGCTDEAEGHSLLKAIDGSFDVSTVALVDRNGALLERW